MKRFFIFLSFVLIIILVSVFVFRKTLFEKLNHFLHRPGSCLILEEKYCKNVKIIDFFDGKMAVANLPKETILFSPLDGYFDSRIIFSTKDGLEDECISVNKSVSGLETETYFLIFSKENDNKFGLIKKGDQIGKVLKEKLNNLEDYNLAFYISQKKPDNNGFMLRDDLLIKIFSGK